MTQTQPNVLPIVADAFVIQQMTGKEWGLAAQDDHFPHHIDQSKNITKWTDTRTFVGQAVKMDGLPVIRTCSFKTPHEALAAVAKWVNIGA